jgi:threonine dehydrogenase-like Zn-dependent dehydrogenase
MLDIVLIVFATGIVSRLAKSKGYNPVVFGAGTVGLAFLCGFAGAYFFGAAGDILGIFVGGVIMEEITRNMSAKPKPKKQVFCSSCGWKQDWEENKLCEKCRSLLHQ